MCFADLKFKIQFEDYAVLPAFRGTTLRGAFGYDPVGENTARLLHRALVELVCRWVPDAGELMKTATFIRWPETGMPGRHAPVPRDGPEGAAGAEVP